MRSKGKRGRAKQKRLDAICENEYNRNHVEGHGGEGGDVEVRRSSRVRRAPEFLDISPSPPKKRKKVSNDGKKEVSPLKGGSQERGLETEGEWSSRLRTRGKNVKGSPSGKRVHFTDIDGGKGEEKEVEVDAGNSTVVTKRPGRIKASEGSGDLQQETEFQGDKDISEKNEVELEEIMGEENVPDLDSGACEASEREVMDANVLQLVEREQGRGTDDLLLEDDCVRNENDFNMEQRDKESDQVVGMNQNEMDNDGEVAGIPSNEVQDRECHDGNAILDKGDGQSLEDDDTVKTDKSNLNLHDALGKPRIKEGRRCGLCGGGTDGKPPKKLALGMGESENEAYSGSSSSEEPTYDIWDGFGDEPGWLGRLLGPINDRYGIAGIWVHQHCAVWSPEVYFADVGCLKNVRTALCRGKALKCTRCGRRGATIGCRVDRCPKTYHLPCARVSGCIFDHRKFLIACTDHRHLFQPHGSHYLSHIKKLKAKKKKLEMRKQSMESWRKDIEAEEKWLENCGEDEEFLKRESKRLHRDLLRIAPEYIGGSQPEGGKLFQGWESVAGLQDVIQCMKEVVILPLLYPELFENLGITPPRGVLLHGHPGTGKTLVVRALIGSCARGDKRIAYFARKGADCLGKYVGDAERQLRLLFQVAEKCQPSIIFFDEIDGLAPARTKQQDQTHSSVVSTLLALMDGLKSRGSVMVIGATNRPDAIDPALRRPGRFDREVHFPLPSAEDRAAILVLHTKTWRKPLSGSLLKWIAKRTVGFAGADLQALCTQAAIIALKRNFPLHEVLSTAGEKAGKCPLPAIVVEERDWLEALSCSPPPCSQREAGIAAADVVTSSLPNYLVPGLLQPLSLLLVSLSLEEHLWLPHPLSKAASIIKHVFSSALDKKKVPSDHWWLHVGDLLQDIDVVDEIEMKISCTGIFGGEADLLRSDSDEDDVDGVGARFKSSTLHNVCTRPGLMRNASFVSNKKSSFRILISGKPRFGQRHLASCLLHCFSGYVEIQKLDMATASQEGRGDMLQGIIEILKKCASMGSCLVYMPRIDLWAVEIQHLMDSKSSEDEESCCSDVEVIGKVEPCSQLPRPPDLDHPVQHQDAAPTTSHFWTSFMEQVESISVSSSLMILATSDIPYAELPQKVRHFFRSELLNCSQFTMANAVPQFSVQVEGDFNHDKVMKRSSMELSRSAIRQFVELIHHKTHFAGSSSKQNEIDLNSWPVDTDSQCAQPKKADSHEGVTVDCHNDSCIKVQSAPNVSLKGKSNLMLAISTFGYQILRYPHFAELCWVTSKLKEGPCADVTGPWKGWPFNSCIIRPGNLVDKVDSSGVSSNLKNKEKSGIVRGLVAVGLSAYRGMYTSLKEVCLEVRRVLELVVGQIDMRIQAGKDRYQYVQLLSQVAYLEDMVYGWAHALKNLEMDATKKGGSPRQGSANNGDDCPASANKPVQIEPCNLSIPSSNPNGEMGESICQTARNTECINLNQGHDEFFPNGPEGSAPVSRESPKQVILAGNPSLDCNIEDLAAGNLLNVTDVTKQNVRDVGQPVTESPQNNAPVERDSRPLNNITLTTPGEPSGCSKDAFNNSDEMNVDLAAVKLSTPAETRKNVNGFSLTGMGFTTDNGVYVPGQHIEQVQDSSSINAYPSSASGLICSYSCCSKCVAELHRLVQKTLAHEWEMREDGCTLEDVHEVVAALAVDLLSAVRKIFDVEKVTNSVHQKPKYKKHAKLSVYPERRKCHCKVLGHSTLRPAECSCHSLDSNRITSDNSSNTQCDLDSSFVFKDGVLIPVGPYENISFHCKIENMCLCSLMESIASC